MDSGLFNEPTLEDADNNEELLGHLKSARAKFLEFLELKDADGWELYKDEDGVAMWTRPTEGSDVKCVKRVMEVNVSATDMAKVLNDPEAQRSADERMKEYSFVHEYAFGSNLVKVKLAGNLVVSDREGHLFVTDQTLTDGSRAIVGFSVETDKVKLDDGCVEATFHMLVSHIQEISDSKCKVTTLAHVNPNGSIPTTLINSMLGHRHTQFINMKKIAESA